MEDADETMEPWDPRYVTVLREAEWQRIQDKLKIVTREEELLMEEAERRKALHLKSQEVVKSWPDIITDVTQKKLEEKRKREEIEEEKRKQIDIEEAKYQAEKTREAIERAKTQIHYRNERIKGLHSALLLTEVLKEREAQIELKEKMKNEARERDKLFPDKANAEAAAKSELESAMRRRLDCEANAEDIKDQIRVKEALREQKKLQCQKDREEMMRRHELYLAQAKMEADQREAERKNLMQNHLEHMANRNLTLSLDAQREQAEDEQRRLYLAAQLRSQKEREKQWKEAQSNRLKTLHTLAVARMDDTDDTDQRIARSIAEKQAEADQRQRLEDEMRADMLKSIAEHREAKQREKELRDKTDKQRMHEETLAKREMIRIACEKEELLAKEWREMEQAVQNFNVSQMAAKTARREQRRLNLQEEMAREAQLAAVDDLEFERYSRSLINAAAQAKKNVFPLCKAARKGLGGRDVMSPDGSGGTQASKPLVRGAKDIRKLNEPTNLEDCKRRLGFME
ncbi:unnamed protein product [Ophioblennius macclurei]